MCYSNYIRTCLSSPVCVTCVLCGQTGNGSAAVLMRRMATSSCLEPNGKAELTLSPLSRAGMPGSLRYEHLSREE